MQLTLLDYLLRLLPETIIFVFASYAFSNVKASRNNLVKASLLISIIVFIIRAMPITYGVHIILNLIIQTVIIAGICKISIVKLAKAGIFSTIILLLSEGLTMLIYRVFLKVDLSVIFQNDIKKILYGMPSLVIFAFIVIKYYNNLNKRNKLKDV